MFSNASGTEEELSLQLLLNIKSLGELRRDCSLSKSYKAFSTERLVQK